jgi:O-antigen ligase
MLTSKLSSIRSYAILGDAQVWLRMAIITGVILACAGLPLAASPGRQVLLLGALLALGTAVVFLKAPQLGLIALIITALIVPSPNLPGGLNYAVLLLGVLVALWLLDMLVRKPSASAPLSRTTWPLIALAGVAVLSFLVGQLNWFQGVPHAPLEAQLAGLLIFILSAGAFLMVAYQINELRWLEWMTWIFLALAALFIAGWLVPGMGSITGRLFQVRTTSNSMFWLWIVALALGQALFNRTLHSFWRVALCVLVVATLYVAFVRAGDWKSGYLPGFAAVAVVFMLRSWGFAILGALTAPVAAYFLSAQAIATDEYSYSTRLEAWDIVLNMVKASPILGFGPSNYYWYTPLFPIRGWRVEFNSHSQYVDLIAQVGLLGLACYVWFLAEVGLLGWRLRNRAPAGFAQAYVIGTLAGLAGIVLAGALADWLLPFVYNIGLSGYRGSILAWLFLGGLVSIERMMYRQAETDTSPRLAA